MYMAGVPSHVIQRGNNRDACFYSDQDYLFYLECLQDACKRYHVAVHAYVLMTNHVHLLLTPEEPTGISNNRGQTPIKIKGVRAPYHLINKEPSGSIYVSESKTQKVVT